VPFPHSHGLVSELMISQLMDLLPDPTEDSTDAAVANVEETAFLSETDRRMKPVGRRRRPRSACSARRQSPSRFVEDDPKAQERLALRSGIRQPPPYRPVNMLRQNPGLKDMAQESTDRLMGARGSLPPRPVDRHAIVPLFGSLPVRRVGKAE
jgi:hypothetical protein